MGAGNVVSYQGVSLRNEYFYLVGSRFLVEAGGGNDYVYSDDSDDILYGQGGRDLLRGSGGNDQFFGDFSADDSDDPRDGDADLIAAGAGDDVVYGSVGNDFLCGEQGSDTIHAGRDNDLVYGGSGSDRIYGGDGNDLLYGSSEQSIRVDFWAAITLDFDGVTDEPLPQSILANAGGGYIEDAFANGIPDTIDGGAGNDTIFGNFASNNRMIGGSGNDLFHAAGQDNQVIEAVNGGTDSVRARLTHTLAANVENLTLTDSFNVNGSGNAANNILVGNTGNNMLTGFAGADQLTGGAGADKFLIRTLSESTVASTGRDFIRDFNHAQGDRIDLHYIDANATVSGDQAFGFIGATAFGHHAGELRAVTAGTTTTVYGDVNGDAAADFSILVIKTTFQPADFIL